MNQNKHFESLPITYTEKILLVNFTYNFTGIMETWPYYNIVDSTEIIYSIINIKRCNNGVSFI